MSNTFVMFGNKKFTVHQLMLTNTTFDFNNVSLNVAINVNINKCCRSI